MHKQAASLLGCIFALVAVIFASLLSNNTNTPLHIEHLNISSSSILQVCYNLIKHDFVTNFQQSMFLKSFNVVMLKHMKVEEETREII